MSEPRHSSSPFKKTAIRFRLNGHDTKVEAYPMERLLDVIRVDASLTGTKEGCGEGECGACSILMDGRLVNSCLIPAAQAEGRDLLTIEGLTPESATTGAPGGAEAPPPSELDGVQRAFLEYGGAQCGICTPGMILAAKALLARHPHPTEEQVREGLAGNLCRCTGYMKIFDAVVRAHSSEGGSPA